MMNYDERQERQRILGLMARLYPQTLDDIFPKGMSVRHHMPHEERRKRKAKRIRVREARKRQRGK